MLQAFQQNDFQWVLKLLSILITDAFDPFKSSKPFSKISLKVHKMNFTKINGALIDNCWYQIPCLQAKGFIAKNNCHLFKLMSRLKMIYIDNVLVKNIF